MKKLLLFLTLSLLADDAFAADAQQLVIGPELPIIAGSVNGSALNDTLVINSTNDSIGMVDQISATDTITQLCVLHNQRVAGDPPAYTMSLQGVSAANGLADGSTKSSGNATCTYNPPANSTQDGTEQCCTMTSSYAATKGELLAVTITCASGCDGSNNSQFGVALTGNNNPISFPYGYTITDGGAAAMKSRTPLMALRSATRYYGNVPLTHTVSTYNSDSTPDERAVKFTISSSYCSTIKLKGFSIYGRVPITATTGSVRLYDSDGTTVLDTISIDGDINAAVGASNDRKSFRKYFNSSITLNCGTAYRLGYRADNTTSAISMTYSTYTSTAAMADIAWTSNFQLSTQSDGSGSWSDTSTIQPWVNLILEDWTAPSGGGLSTQKQLSGGTQ